MSRLKSLVCVLMLLSLPISSFADPTLEIKKDSSITLKSSQSTSSLRLNSKGRPNTAVKQRIVISNGKSSLCVTQQDGTVHCDMPLSDEGD